MTARSFFLYLTLVSVASAALLSLMAMNDVLAPDMELGWLSLIIFIILTVSIYGLALFTAVSPNPNHFTLLFLGVVFFKILLCAALVYVYQVYRHPSSKYFVFPFLMIYLIFTVFEVFTMTRINSKYAKPVSK